MIKQLSMKRSVLILREPIYHGVDSPFPSSGGFCYESSWQSAFARQSTQKSNNKLISVDANVISWTSKRKLVFDQAA